MRGVEFLHQLHQLLTEFENSRILRARYGFLKRHMCVSHLDDDDVAVDEGAVWCGVVFYSYWLPGRRRSRGRLATAHGPDGVDGLLTLVRDVAALLSGLHLGRTDAQLLARYCSGKHDIVLHQRSQTFPSEVVV